MSDSPTCQRIGDVIYVSWPRRYLFTFGHFQQAPWGLQAELAVSTPDSGLELAWGQVQLTSSDSRWKLSSATRGGCVKGSSSAFTSPANRAIPRGR
jgi:hypothetical protein